MTEAKKKPHLHILFPLVSALALLCVLYQTEIAVERMNYGLHLCVTTVIPTLFPFMVLSELIVAGGAIRPLGRLFARPCRALFGISEQSACVLLLGWLCGFPVGTRCAVKLRRQGLIDDEELSHLLCFVNIPSSAFLIGTVGDSLMGDRRFGVALYCITLLSAVLIGAATNTFRHKKKTQIASFLERTVFLKTDTVRVFNEAVSDSALAMLRICAFVVFFAVVVGVVEALVATLSLPQPLYALLFGLFEMTGGTARAAMLNDPALSETLCMFLIGWSGISVHCQMMSLCTDVKLSPRSYLLAKASHGLLNVLLWSGARQLFF